MNEQPAPADRGGPQPSQAHAPDSSAGYSRSLQEDLEALYRDGRTYVAAELAYQKARAGFIADQVKTALVFGIIGALFASLTLIGLVVGVIMALAPMIGPWAACAVVVIALALCTFLAVRSAQRHWNKMMAAFNASSDGGHK